MSVTQGVTDHKPPTAPVLRRRAGAARWDQLLGGVVSGRTLSTIAGGASDAEKLGAVTDLVL